MLKKPHLCRVCNTDISHRYSTAKVCFPCADNNGKRTGGRKAIALVLAAVKKGILPPVKTLTCVDCGKPARVYEHRDYNKPLEVEPVCNGCNIKRGPAIYVNHLSTNNLSI